MILWQKNIISNPDILAGKPVIINTRISVNLILEKLASGDSIDDIIAAYPSLTKESVLSCLFFAAEAVKNEIFFSKAS